MDIKQIEKLMEAMKKSRMRRLALKTEGFEIELERECYGGEISPPPMFVRSNVEMPREGQPMTPAPLPKEEASVTPPTTVPARFVTSPMVGTFYATPSPEDPPFVRVGDRVDEESVVCIIEAMKVMNEVKAGIRGTVAEVLLKSGDPVEFGTKILRIESA